jgi:hypothetical protein
MEPVVGSTVPSGLLKFWLPTAKPALRVLNLDYFCVDIDLGGFFLNFPYPAWLCQYSGIDLMPYADILAGLGFQL